MLSLRGSSVFIWRGMSWNEP